MPNIATNHLTIQGEEQRIDEFLEKSSHAPDYYSEFGLKEENDGAEPTFTFAGICPYPRELLETERGNFPLKWKDIKKWDEACWKIMKENPGVERTRLPLPPLKEFQKHSGTGFADDIFFCWRLRDWGTKCDASEFDILKRSDKGKLHRVEMRFSTAHTAPENWLVEASRLFPDLEFFLDYHLDGAECGGTMKVKWGEPIKETFVDEDGEKTIRPIPAMAGPEDADIL